MSTLVPRIYRCFREAYPVITKNVFRYGRVSAPRGMETRELLNASFAIYNPVDTLINRPGWSDAFAAAEAAGLVGGYSDPELLAKINPTMTRFFEERDGRSFQHGAYGPRIRFTLPQAVDRLQDDPDTRQAVLTVFDSNKDFRHTPDVPCTVVLQFTVRDDKLNLHVVMRSNDVWWGLPYDVLQFTQLQLTVANLLNFGYGTYFHTAHSLHVYARDFDAVEDLAPSKEREFHPTGFGWAGVDVLGVQLRVRALRPGGYPLRRMSPTESWYKKKLAYVSPRYGV